MKAKTYLFHQDAGHGWLQVPRKDVNELGIANEITAYSYQRGNDVYLEEDKDLSTFVTAYENKYGYQPEILMPARFPDESPIRGFEDYYPKVLLTKQSFVIK